jgi:hypothetical protein
VSWLPSTIATKVMAGTDDWSTDEEIRKSLEMVEGMKSPKPPADEVAHKVDGDMKSDPRVMLLAITAATTPDF